MILNSKEYELSDQLKKLLDISKTIYLQLMKGECKYDVKSKVSEDVFKAFVEYLIEGTDIEIHFDTIYELKQLGEEFSISELLEKIESKKNKWREIEKFFEQQQPSTSSEANEGKISTEQKISQLYEILDFQMKKIEELQNEVQSLKTNYEMQIEELQKVIQSLEIENENKISEQEKKFVNENRIIMDQYNKQRLDDNKKLEDSIKEKFQKIENEMNSNQELFQKQESSISNHDNKFELINNQFELIKNEFETKIKDQLQIYITKDISNSLIFHQVSFLFFKSHFKKIILSNFYHFYFLMQFQFESLISF